MSLFLLANPAAGNGRGRRALAPARRALEALGPVRVLETARAGDEARLTRTALDDGCTTLAVLGGDGTWSKAAGALADAGAAVPLALLAAGTAGDLAKSIGVPAADYDAMAALLAAPVVRPMDLLRVEERWVANVLGFGFDPAVLATAARLPRQLGPAVYAVAALRDLLGYRGEEVRVDDGPWARRLMLVLGNGRFFGGAFRIAPGALLDDGAAEVLAVAGLAPWRRVRLFAAAVGGAHLAHPAVTHARAARVRLAFRAPPLYDADGELCRAGAAALEVRCVPGAIRVAAGSGGAWSAPPPAA